MKCPKCQTENAEDAVFCCICGEKISKVMKQKTDKEHTMHTIFISHAEADEKIAAAFHELLDNILCQPCGIEYKIFRSSAAGSIPCGTVPYDEITDNINKSGNVFCLLTNNSFDRPWVMYEIGYVKGKSDGTRLMPIVINMDDQDKLENKPYSYFRRYPCDKEHLAELMLQLLKHIYDQQDIGNEDKLKKKYSDAISKFLRKIKKY
jgi:uncharacterized protein YfcZ (UPF0381/DUF406 family)